MFDFVGRIVVGAAIGYGLGKLMEMAERKLTVYMVMKKMKENGELDEDEVPFQQMELDLEH